MTRSSLLAAAGLAVILAAGPALAGQHGEERLYDAQGKYQGRLSQDAANPAQKSLYDAKGRYQGRIMTDPATGESRAYDAHGKYLGRTTGGRMPAQRK